MVFGNMESLKLSEQDQRIYAELFSSCDVENTGRVTGVKASELFLTSGLTQEALLQISEVCGAKRLGHFGRSQFYIALKLIAAVQCGLPVSLDSLNTGAELPTPKFIRFDGDGRRLIQSQPYNQHMPTEQDYYQDRMIAGMNQPNNQQTGAIRPPPKHIRNIRTLPGQEGIQLQNNINIRDSPNDSRSPPFSPKDSPPLSPGVQPTAPQKIDVIGKQVSAPAAVVTNRYEAGYSNNQFEVSPQKVEKGWASFEEDHQGLISEETKETQWAHFSDHNKGDTSSISSEAESVEDVWSINDEQREYYINQFTTMQPDMAGKISGAVAKEFFEKSKLPITELSKIWNLADMNRDGMLSLDEFCIAMHLVVLRRNDIPLPDKIPPALMPYVPLVNVNPDEPFAADLPPGSTMKRLTPPSPQQPEPTQQWSTNFPSESTNESCSSVSSPGTKPTPVNFEFKPVAADPESKIVHPVAVRMSPDGIPIVDDKPRTFSAAVPSTMDGSIRQPQLIRPPVNQHGELLDRPTTLGIESTAPLPPPRKGHSRSSSLDNQLVDLSDNTHRSSNLMAPPAVPPRPSPKDAPGGNNKLVMHQQSEPGYSHHHSHQHHHQIQPGENFADFSRFPSIPSQEVLNIVPGERTVVAGAEAAIVDTHRRAVSLDYNQIPSSSFIPYQRGPGRGGGEPVNATEQPSSVINSSSNHSSNSPINGYVPRERLGSRDDLGKDETDKTSKPTLPRQDSTEKKELQASVRKQRERNHVLLQLNNELNQELQEVMEQRIALEIQLDHLRPYSS